MKLYVLEIWIKACKKERLKSKDAKSSLDRKKEFGKTMLDYLEEYAHIVANSLEGNGDQVDQDFKISYSEFSGFLQTKIPTSSYPSLDSFLEHEPDVATLLKDWKKEDSDEISKQNHSTHLSFYSSLNKTEERIQTLSLDGSFVVKTRGSNIILHEISTKKETAFSLFGGKITLVGISSNNQYLVGYDQNRNEVLVYNTESQKFRRLKDNFYEILSMEVNDTGQFVMIKCRINKPEKTWIFLYNCVTNSIVRSADLTSTNPSWFFVPGSNYMIEDVNGLFKEIDLLNPALSKELSILDNSELGMDLPKQYLIGPDGKQMVFIYEKIINMACIHGKMINFNSQIIVYDYSAGESIKPKFYSFLAKEFELIGFTRDNHLLIKKDRSIIIFDMKDKKLGESKEVGEIELKEKSDAKMAVNEKNQLVSLCLETGELNTYDLSPILEKANKREATQASVPSMK